MQVGEVNAGTNVVNTVGGETTTFKDQGIGFKIDNADSGAPFKGGKVDGVYVGDKRWQITGTSGLGNLGLGAVGSKGMSEHHPLQFIIFWGLSKQTSTMYDISSTSRFEFDMSGHTELHLEYTEDQKWVVI